MIDLHSVKDHPATVVENLNTTGPRPGVWTNAKTQLLSAAADLRTYEMHHDVTFAALDNDTLEAIREVYDREPDLAGMSGEFHEDLTRVELERLYELESLVSDLLGLED